MVYLLHRTGPFSSIFGKKRDDIVWTLNHRDGARCLITVATEAVAVHRNLRKRCRISVAIAIGPLRWCTDGITCTKYRGSRRRYISRTDTSPKSDPTISAIPDSASVRSAQSDSWPDPTKRATPDSSSPIRSSQSNSWIRSTANSTSVHSRPDPTIRATPNSSSPVRSSQSDPRITTTKRTAVAVAESIRPRTSDASKIGVNRTVWSKTRWCNRSIRIHSIALTNARIPST